MLLKRLRLYYSDCIALCVEKTTLAKLIDHLRPNEAVFVSDFKMRILAHLYIESQTEFFGKKGLPLLGVMIIYLLSEDDQLDRIAARAVANETTEADFYNRDDSNDDKQYGKIGDTNVEFLDCLLPMNASEESFAVSSIWEGAFKYCRATKPHIVVVFVYTDSATNFSGVKTHVCLPFVSELTGLICTGHYTSTSGGGKTGLDLHFSYLGSNVEAAVAMGQGDHDFYDQHTLFHTISQRLVADSDVAIIELDESRRSLFEIDSDKFSGQILNSHERIFFYLDNVTGKIVSGGNILIGDWPEASPVKKSSSSVVSSQSLSEDETLRAVSMKPEERYSFHHCVLRVVSFHGDGEVHYRNEYESTFPRLKFPGTTGVKMLLATKEGQEAMQGIVEPAFYCSPVINSSNNHSLESSSLAPSSTKEVNEVDASLLYDLLDESNNKESNDIKNDRNDDSDINSRQ